MLRALSLVVPLGLAGAVSPMLFTEQALLLAGENGLRAGRRFAAGVVVVLLAFVLFVLLFGRALELPKAPTLSSSIDLVIAAVLLLAAVGVQLSAHRSRDVSETHHASKRRARLPGSRGAFPFGAFSMATNVTTLALAAAAAKEISATDVEEVGRLVLAVVLVALASSTAWLPVALTAAAPTTADGVIGGLRELIEHHGRTLTVAVLVGAGLFLAVRAVVRLQG